MNYNRVLALGGCLGCPDNVMPQVEVETGGDFHSLYTTPTGYGESPDRISYLDHRLDTDSLRLLLDLPKASVESLGFTHYTVATEGAAYHSEQSGWAVFKVSSP